MNRLRKSGERSFTPSMLFLAQSIRSGNFAETGKSRYRTEMTDNNKRRALEALIERAAESLNLSEEESKALIAPISEQFRRLEADH